MKPNKRVKLGISADMAIQESTSPSLNVDPFKYAYFANPYERIYNEDGSYAADNTYYSITHANGAYVEIADLDKFTSAQIKVGNTSYATVSKVSDNAYSAKFTDNTVKAIAP